MPVPLDRYAFVATWHDPVSSRLMRQLSLLARNADPFPPDKPDVHPVPQPEITPPVTPGIGPGVGDPPPPPTTQPPIDIPSAPDLPIPSRGMALGLARATI